MSRVPTIKLANPLVVNPITGEILGEINVSDQNN